MGSPQIFSANLRPAERERLARLDDPLVAAIRDEGIPIRDDRGWSLEWRDEDDSISLRRNVFHKDNAIIFSITKTDFNSLSDADFLERFRQHLIARSQ